MSSRDMTTVTARRSPVAMRPRTHRGLARPPGPRNLPGLGAVLDFQNVLDATTRFARRYGDVVYVDLAGTDTYLVTHPDDIAALLVGSSSRFMKDDLTHELSRFLGRGLLTSEGAFWRRQRKIAAPSFQRTHIGKFADTMVAATRGRLGQLRQGGVRDVHTDMMVVTLEIVLQTMFGAATLPDIDSVGHIVEALMTGFADNYLSWRRLVPRPLRAKAHAALDHARDQLDEILFGLIRARREAGGGGDDLLAHLLAATDDDGHGMTDAQLRDEVATVFLAGHETTALALSYALWLLARTPDTQRRVQEEVDAVLGTRPATLDDVARLPLCEAVIKESMRLYPPAYVVGREALADVEIAGWVVPRGAQVLAPQWVVHRDERWFSDPLAFRPERWLDGLDRRLHRFAYFPFGGGTRVCVGNHFAMLEGILVLATLMQHLDVAPEGEHRLELMAAVTLRPRTGVRLQVSPRRNSDAG
jgi:cytochrome P450